MPAERRGSRTAGIDVSGPVSGEHTLTGGASVEDDRRSGASGGDGALMARWAVVLGASALAVALWTALAPAAAGGGGDAVRASRFLVVDGSGRTRGSFGITEEGPVLELTDPGGSYLARLETAVRGPELRLDGPEGQVRLGLGDVVQEGAGLSLYDASDRLRLGLAYSGGAGGTNLVLADDAGRVRLGLTVDSAGPYAVLLGADGQPLWERPEEAEEQP